MVTVLKEPLVSNWAGLSKSFDGIVRDTKTIQTQFDLSAMRGMTTDVTYKNVRSYLLT